MLTFIDRIYQFNRPKDKYNHMAFSLDEEKTSDKIQVLVKTDMERMYHNTVKHIYGKATANIIRDRKVQAFLVPSGRT